MDENRTHNRVQSISKRKYFPNVWQICLVNNPKFTENCDFQIFVKRPFDRQLLCVWIFFVHQGTEAKDSFPFVVAIPLQF